MTLDKIIVGIGSFAGILFVYWFFLKRIIASVTVDESVDIVVDGGYKPESITVKNGKRIQIHFLRKDPSSCLEEVVLSDFKVRTYLPLNKKQTITIRPDKTGEFMFSCGMNMFHGKIIVV